MQIMPGARLEILPGSGRLAVEVDGQIAGYASSNLTGEYSVVQLQQQEELMRRLQEKLVQVSRAVR